MDAKTIRWVVAAVLIAVGLPLFYQGRYHEAHEGKKKQGAQALKNIGIAFMLVGIIFYLVNLFIK